MRPWIAARNCGDVQPLARRGFMEAGTLEPPKECATRAAGKGASAHHLCLAGSLSHEHGTRSASARQNRNDARSVEAFAARREASAVSVECGGKIGGSARRVGA